jgi:tagatose 1,6-diphosphate aldolase GatY/KbaY
VLSSLTAVLAAAVRAGGAAAAMSCYDLVTADAVLRAAEARRAPCVLLIPPGAVAGRAGLGLVAGCRALAERAAVPACVQIDHVRDLDVVRAGLEAGANAVMADGAHLPFDVNADFVAGAVATAAGHGADVEAELGRVGGHDERAGDPTPGTLTDPRQVGPFLARSGASCLAVSIGNVHGATGRTTPLDWPLLAAIRRATDAPLALHGGSGVAGADLRAAARAGIAKVNVNAQLRGAWLAATAEATAAGASVPGVQRAVGERVEEVAAGVLELVSG